MAQGHWAELSTTRPGRRNRWPWVESTLEPPPDPIPDLPPTVSYELLDAVSFTTVYSGTLYPMDGYPESYSENVGPVSMASSNVRFYLSGINHEGTTHDFTIRLYADGDLEWQEFDPVGAISVAFPKASTGYYFEITLDGAAEPPAP